MGEQTNAKICWLIRPKFFSKLKMLIPPKSDNLSPASNIREQRAGWARHADWYGHQGIVNVCISGMIINSFYLLKDAQHWMVSSEGPFQSSHFHHNNHQTSRSDVIIID